MWAPRRKIKRTPSVNNIRLFRSGSLKTSPKAPNTSGHLYFPACRLYFLPGALADRVYFHSKPFLAYLALREKFHGLRKRADKPSLIKLLDGYFTALEFC